jgi:sugar lactone lactonase YvrE
MRTTRFALLLVVVLASFAAARPALADDPSGITLVPIPPPNAAPGQETVVLSAQLISDGSPVAGVPVTFYIVTNVFGERLMKVGDALSDATGAASVLYRPTWDGDHTVVARFAGEGGYPATQTSFSFNAQGVVSPWQPAQFGLEPVRRWLPIAVGVGILAVLATLGFTLVTTVIGIPAAATRPARETVPSWDIQVHRPAPLGRTLVVMALLLVVAAFPAAWLVGKARAPNEASLSTANVHSGHAVTGGDGESATAQPTALPAAEPLPATLVRSVQTTTFDEGGQPAPGSVAMPADVAINAGRIRILDSNGGRIATVTPEGTLASILNAGAYADISLKGAPAMLALGEKLYVVTQDGLIVVVDSAGQIESVISPVIPAGQAPFAPAGIALTESGEIWVSDSANHRILLLNGRGEFQQVIGEGIPSAGPQGFNTPGGLTVDGDGNLYVADTLNHVVKKYSPLGIFLQTIGEGRLDSPSAVAVDEEGTVFVADEAAHLVSAFSPDGAYLGSIGEGQLEAPHSVKTDGGLLYVMDRLEGLFVFQPETALSSGP